MEHVNISSAIEIFSDIKDPRIGPAHFLIDIIVITILATICGANNYVEIAAWGRANKDWLKTYLRLSAGIPSHDTFTNVFRFIDPMEFEICFLKWMHLIQDKTMGDVIAIDGKVLRGSYDKNSNKAAINMVSAWSGLNSVILGQVKTGNKSNEITAIPELLKLLDIKDCIITIDAAGCQEKITKDIVEQGGDYVIALKGNQSTLYNAAQEQFEEMLENHPGKIDFHETVESGHGRQETRNYYVFHDDVENLDGSNKFENLSAIGVVESTREDAEKITHGLRFYILSTILTAEMFGGCVRAHWGVENNVHWQLDVTFNEDSSRIRKNNGPENLSIARRIALNLLKNNGDDKKSIAVKRKTAGWDKDYLLQVIGF